MKWDSLGYDIHFNIYWISLEKIENPKDSGSGFCSIYIKTAIVDAQACKHTQQKPYLISFCCFSVGPLQCGHMTTWEKEGLEHLIISVEKVIQK